MTFLADVVRMTEAHWQRQVIQYAELMGWRTWHDVATNTPRRCASCGEIRRTPRNASGLPDLILVRRPRIVWVELKADRGKVSPSQAAWLADLRACDQEVWVFRPSDWPVVETVLR